MNLVPANIWQKIFSSLDPSSMLFSLRLVCRAWNTATRSKSFLLPWLQLSPERSLAEDLILLLLSFDPTTERVEVCVSDQSLSVAVMIDMIENGLLTLQKPPNDDADLSVPLSRPLGAAGKVATDVLMQYAAKGFAEISQRTGDSCLLVFLSGKLRGLGLQSCPFPGGLRRFLLVSLFLRGDISFRLTTEKTLFGLGRKTSIQIVVNPASRATLIGAVINRLSSRSSVVPFLDRFAAVAVLSNIETDSTIARRLAFTSTKLRLAEIEESLRLLTAAQMQCRQSGRLYRAFYRLHRGIFSYTGPIPFPSPFETETSSTATAASSSTDNMSCVVCIENKKEVLFYPCGHIACCMRCGAPLQQCPICRVVVKECVKIYVT